MTIIWPNYFSIALGGVVIYSSGKVVVEVHVSALGYFVDETHLEEFVDDFEYEVLRVEVLECIAHALVNGVERKAASRVPKLL